MSIKRSHIAITLKALFIFTCLLPSLSQPIIAQQHTVEFIPLEQVDEPYFRPRCPTVNGQNPCFIVVFMLPDELLIDYDDYTQNLMDQWGNQEQYQRARTGNITAFTFPSHGGYVEVQEPGAPELQDARFRVEEAEPGSIFYYRVEKADYRQPAARLQINQTRRRTQQTSPTAIGTRREPERGTETEARSPTPASQPAASRDYRTPYLMSVDYSNTIRTYSNLFRDQGSALADFRPGTTFSLTFYRLDRFLSARAGFAYVSSSGNHTSHHNNGFITEDFEYEQLSFFASYSPSFYLQESRTTYLLFYTDLGMSANLVNMVYTDVELIERSTYSEEIRFQFEMEDHWLPGINLGIGLLYNYKAIGVHAGIHMEAVFFEDFSTTMSNIYPMVGINLRMK